MLAKGLCTVEGCGNAVTLKHLDKKGRKVYRAVCQRHHRGPGWWDKARPHECVKCGWKGECQRHRIVPAEGYVAANVQNLCPNCHKAAHGRGAWNTPQPTP